MSHDMARRGFLRRTIAVVPVAAVATACTPDTPAATASAQAPQAPAAASGPYVPRFFTAPEWTFIQKAVDRLIPPDASGPGAVEAGVPEFIDRQMDAVFGHAAIWYMQGPFVESPPEFGYQGRMLPRDVYRAGIAAVDAHCKNRFDGKTFAQLDAGAQDALLKGLEAGQVELQDVSAKTFFGFLLQNTREGYLSDPIHGGNKDAGAWKMIGFPGARADYTDWVGRPGERYPLPPVSIAGPQG